MRTRNEIEIEVAGFNTDMGHYDPLSKGERATLELLLDIRDLLIGQQQAKIAKGIHDIEQIGLSAQNFDKDVKRNFPQ
jgi:hypothetical protein